MKIPATIKSTAIGFIAIILWGMLALLTSFNRNIPSFQLTAMTFAIAFVVGIFVFVKSGADFSCLKQPPAVWINGVAGLFGYHLFYFTALKNAPPIEASLIAYLWPILIVLFASFLPGERLRWQHLLGVVLGFLGVCFLILQGGSFSLNKEYTLGYFMALLCAVTWSLYSVVSRRHRAVPTLLIGVYCGITALLSLCCHLLFETTVMPSPTEWLTIVLLGFGPVGCAFFVWDHGMKHGNIKLLGALSYVAPLLSSALLVLFGRAQATLSLIAACLLIVGGAAVAALKTPHGSEKHEKQSV